MKTHTYKDALDKLSKGRLIELLEIYSKQCIVIDGLWFLVCEEKKGHEFALATDIEVWKRYGSIEAKRLKYFLKFETVDTLERVSQLLLLTPFFAPLGGVVKVYDDHINFTVMDCRPQKARITKGLGEFACKQVAEAYYDSFLKELNPDLVFDCKFCPPDQHPEEEWCSWIIRFIDN